jgi:hypothetical protein
MTYLILMSWPLTLREERRLSVLENRMERVILEKLTGLQQVEKFAHFIEPESLLLHSQMPVTCLYPEPAQFSPYSHILLLEYPS